MIPDKEQALKIHSKLGSSETVISHCEAVAEIANSLAESFEEKGIPVDSKSIYAAALLHDIGRNRTHSIKHGYVGAQIALENGVDEKVAEIISRHVGAGITPEEAPDLGLPPDRSYIPETLEEKIVCFADKVVGPNGQPVPLEVEIEKFKRKGLDSQRLVRLKASLEEQLGEDPETAIRKKSRNA